MTSPEARHFTESFASYFTSVGFPKMPARVLMSLMISESGMTAAEIGDDLHISAAAVSGATRQLLLWNLIKRTPVRGSRRDRFEVLHDAWYRSVVSQHGVYGQLARMAGTGAQVLPIGSKGAERVIQMQEFFVFLNDRMADLMREWEARPQARPEARPQARPEARPQEEHQNEFSDRSPEVRRARARSTQERAPSARRR